jgi:short-subunit dehydrogenase
MGVDYARQELEGDNIRVILVYPRLTETNLARTRWGISRSDRGSVAGRHER